jgi:hypothetical protein
MLDVVPSDPARDEYRQGNTMGPAHRHWRRAKIGRRFRLFFRYDSKAKVIVYAWVNDEQTLRSSGSKSDPYAVFEKMLGRGKSAGRLERIGTGKQAGLEQTGVGIPHVAGDDHEHDNTHQHRRTAWPQRRPRMARLCPWRTAGVELVGIQGCAGSWCHRRCCGWSSWPCSVCCSTPRSGWLCCWFRAAAVDGPQMQSCRSKSYHLQFPPPGRTSTRLRDYGPYMGYQRLRVMRSWQAMSTDTGLSDALTFSLPLTQCLAPFPPAALGVPRDSS